MATTLRPQRRYDHRLRDLVQRNGDLTIATSLGVPRSTARGWLTAAPTKVISLDVAAELSAATFSNFAREFSSFMRKGRR